ncbi:hypothetical protein FUAX_46220 (plasmid) [Fulvitalea axinellae]|uniref:RagB/SusD family nutrient uptake outer membrane protein n=1 Tax=Fulvitalea axinellae TaxID=1182444 RepID=A0AAU9DLW8_9BACT|nr:hypothetical protein FUAX_46220 [Fulvitalea axinellae]
MKIRKYIPLLALASMLLGACNDDFLNEKDTNSYNPEEVWNDIKLVDAYIAYLYRDTFESWPVNSGNLADESGGLYDQSYITPSSKHMKPWNYEEIYKINLLFQEIEKGTLSDSQKKYVKGQAYFLRAWNYFRMVVHYGGVPIIKKPQTTKDDLNVTRNSTKECFDFIVSDLDEAIASLPDKSEGDNYGRISKSIALAFKGRVLLYKASPQFNPSNPYDNEYWDEAYTANKNAKETLEALGYGLLDNYNDIFLTENHKEAILPVIFTNPGRTNGRKEHSVRPITESKNGTGGDQPIWRLVNAYPMKDGKQPGESMTYAFDEQRFWENRDPRFYSTIVYNGAIYELSGKSGRRQYTDIELGTTEDGFGKTQGYYRTGFYSKKGIQVSLPQAEVSLNEVDWLEIRFAEVLMNYAEAANEKGLQGEALEILKKIRKRAGVEEGPDGMYGLKNGMGKDEIREALLHERYIEFTFEGKRFWDLRRHRRLNTLNGIMKFGLEAKLNGEVDVDKAKVYGYLPEDFTYKVSRLIEKDIQTEGGGIQKLTMYMPDTYYFFPISLDDLDKNPNLKQNKDWGGDFDPTL